jgi:hypothetical protein
VDGMGFGYAALLTSYKLQILRFSRYAENASLTPLCYTLLRDSSLPT